MAKRSRDAPVQSYMHNIPSYIQNIKYTPFVLILDSLYFATNKVLLNSRNINTRRSDLADRASPQAAAAKFAYAKSRFGPQGTMATETRPPHHVRSHMDLRKAPSPNINTRNLDLDWRSF